MNKAEVFPRMSEEGKTMDDKTRIESARRGQYVLTLATVDGVLVDRWKVHDGLFGPGDETSTDLSEGRRLGNGIAGGMRQNG